MASEVKSVLDSWVRYEGQVKQKQQKELADSIIAKIGKELENPKVLDQILKQSVADVERKLVMCGVLRGEFGLIRCRYSVTEGVEWRKKQWSRGEACVDRYVLSNSGQRTCKNTIRSRCICHIHQLVEGSVCFVRGCHVLVTTRMCMKHNLHYMSASRIYKPVSSVHLPHS